MDKPRRSAQLALYGLGMPAVPLEIGERPNLSGECDAITADGETIDFKYRRDHPDAARLFDGLARTMMDRKGTPPHGKLTKAEKKREKKQRIKGRLLIQEAQARVNTFFNDMLHHGCAVSRVYYDGNPVVERVDPKDVLK